MAGYEWDDMTPQHRARWNEGQRIKRVRKQYGLSMRDMVEQSGVRFTEVACLEEGYDVDPLDKQKVLQVLRKYQDGGA